MVPLERALMSSYSPPIVTFPLSVRVSEIAACVLQHTIFPHHTCLSKISPCSRGNRWMASGLRKAKVLCKLSVQLVSKISNLVMIHQRYGRTDRRTPCNRKTALCTVVLLLVHRAVKTRDTVCRHTVLMAIFQMNLGQPVFALDFQSPVVPLYPARPHGTICHV